MEFAIAIFTGLVFLVITECLKPETPSKTSEEEIGEAISKYLTTMKKAKSDSKDNAEETRSTDEG